MDSNSPASYVSCFPRLPRQFSARDPPTSQQHAVGAAPCQSGIGSTNSTDSSPHSANLGLGLAAIFINADASSSRNHWGATPHAGEDAQTHGPSFPDTRDAERPGSPPVALKPRPLDCADIVQRVLIPWGAVQYPASSSAAQKGVSYSHNLRPLQTVQEGLQRCVARISHRGRRSRSGSVCTEDETRSQVDCGGSASADSAPSTRGWSQQRAAPSSAEACQSKERADTWPRWSASPSSSAMPR